MEIVAVDSTDHAESNDMPQMAGADVMRTTTTVIKTPMMATRTVAVIGAGAAGLAVAKVLLEDGFDVTIFERQTKVGGIWSPDWAYAGLRTQAVGGFMEYSNLPDTEAKYCAPWQSIHNYLQKYADTFHITERIRFQTKVKLIDKDDLKNANHPWIIEVETADSPHSQTFQFDLVVVASGLFSTPFTPTFRGQSKFAGSIVFANDIKTPEQLENKRTAIVGGGKTAIDLATQAGLYGRSCYMIFRRSHWVIPPNLLHGYLPVEYVFTRLFSVIFDPFPYAPHSALFYFLHRIFTPLYSKIFDLMGDDIIDIYGNDLYKDEIFIPKYPMRNAENVSRMTEEYVQLIREDRIVRKLTSIDEILDGTTVRLDSGEILQLDLIVCATGFVERFPFFSEAFNQILGQNTTTPTANEGADLDLYRRTIPLGVPNIAFVGLPTTASTWTCYEVQSHWISDYFLGRMKLPTTEKEMREEIRINRNFIQKLFKRKSYYTQFYWVEPMEIFLQDMGLSLHRTNNWISEYCGVYRPKRLQTLHDERQAKAEGKTPSIWHRRWYFGFGHTVLSFLVLLLFIWFFF